MKKVKILLINEPYLSSLLTNFLVMIGKKRNWEIFSIISVDNKMEENIKNKVFNFRCDMIVLIDFSLVILEFKFRNNRRNDQSTKAMMCIKRRFYVRRVLKWLQLNYPNILNNVSCVNVVGIGFSVFKVEIKLGLKFYREEIKDIEYDEIYLNNKLKIFLGFKTKRDDSMQVNLKIQSSEINYEDLLATPITDRKDLIKFYHDYFPNLTHRLEEWTSLYSNIGIYKNSKLVGAATYNKLKVIEVYIVHIYLICSKERGKGYGTKLMRSIKEVSTRLTTWADEAALKFFIKMNFKVQKKIGFALHEVIPYHSGSTFCASGFNSEELKILREFI